MDYELIVDPDALAPLRGRISESVLPCIEMNLYRLSNDPFTLGQRALTPGPRPGQIFFFDCTDNAQALYHLAANFIFTVDERAIYIRRVDAVLHDCPAVPRPPPIRFARAPGRRLP